MGKRDLIVISSYPEKDGVHSAKTVGVASYTKLLLQSLAKLIEGKITVFAETLDECAEYSENQIKVHRSWWRGGVLSLVQLFLNVSTRTEKVVIVSFEINMFGGYLHAVFAILGMFFLRLKGKKIILILHQAPDDLNDMYKNKYILAMSNIVIKFLYITLRMASTRIIVFEEYLRKVVGGRNVVFIPHLIPEYKIIISKERAREKLRWSKNDKYAVVFGYVAPYKGILELISSWTNDAGYKLVIAGGINPNHQSNQDIIEYYDEVKRLAQEKNVQITGFVPEDLMPYYFVGCDVLILPYKKMFSSSGPLALAWSMGKTILMSEALSKYLVSYDVKDALSKAGLSDREVFIKIGSESIQNSLRTLDFRKVKKYGKWGRLMSDERRIGLVTKMYVEEIDILQEKK